MERHIQNRLTLQLASLPASCADIRKDSHLCCRVRSLLGVFVKYMVTIPIPCSLCFYPPPPPAVFGVSRGECVFLRQIWHVDEQERQFFLMYVTAAVVCRQQRKENFEFVAGVFFFNNATQ